MNRFCYNRIKVQSSTLLIITLNFLLNLLAKEHSMSIQAVGFDLDDTLYSRESIYQNIFAIMQTSVVNIDFTFKEFYSVFQKYSEAEYEKFISREKSRLAYKNDRVIRAYQYFGKSISLDEAIIFNGLYFYFYEAIEPRDGAIQLLDILKEKGYQLFVLTNGPVEDQMRKLRHLKMETFIPSDYWFISDGINCTKPDPKIFQYVEQTLDLKGKEIFYIGDDLNNDILGSQKRDWQTLWLNSGDEDDNQIPHIHSVQKFSDIIEIFNK